MKEKQADRKKKSQNNLPSGAGKMPQWAMCLSRKHQIWTQILSAHSEAEHHGTHPLTRTGETETGWALELTEHSVLSIREGLSKRPSLKN